MPLPTSKNEGSESFPSGEGHNKRNKLDNFFSDEPSKHMPSSSALPVSESRERLNHFFDETASITPAGNTEFREETVTSAHEPETFGETQVGKFLKNLFAKK